MFSLVSYSPLLVFIVLDVRLFKSTRVLLIMIKIMFVISSIVIINTLLEIVQATQNGLLIEKDNKSKSWQVGTRHEIICRGTNKNQKIYWRDPLGNAIDRRHSTSRVYVQERMNQKSSAPVLVLVITQVLVEDTGIWSCRAATVEESVKVCVIDEARFVNTPEEVTVDKGGAITLTCEARGNPEPRLVWHRNGDIITDDETNGTSKYKLMMKYNIRGFEGLLTILSLNIEDAGVYTCQSLQEFQDYDFCYHNESLNINMAINYGPIMPHDSNDTRLIFVSDNQLVQIQCYADGYPSPTYRWYQQFPDHDKEIPNSMIVTNNSVSILNVQANESTFYNRYLCKASNSYGEISNVFKLTPKIVPGRIKELTAANITDKSIILTMSLETDIVETPISKFEVMYVDKTKLQKGKPRKDIDWRDSKVVEVQWNEEDAFSGEMSIEVPGLKPETEYCIRLRAANDVGKSPWSVPLIVVTVEATDQVLDISEDSGELYGDGDLFILIACTIGIVGIIILCVFIIKKS